ncbi:type II toxin-antitoxin system VapC family toxin [Thermanaerothrix sp. 4228-RoL]|uniref:Type II toxin-antitoxin system VapC family toxin n=1 Tax=Thermanaerothrix solaris TaxID=3058434 RepID=A0ABU3NRN7_9CHLR|nr:type II toxin-antitoxin system VapC family toxin [Thermanaerothrix sp. 4228-RoL]MDT8899469.1 type II toxin-antitoxin system VapC family toxin [Thermanaerothrix sp. 4228-RoL]
MAGRAVIDANVTLALFLNLPYSDSAYRLMEQLKKQRQALYAPALWGYECANGLYKAVQLGMISLAKADEALVDLDGMAIEQAMPTVELHHAALRWAERLGQSKAYDAQYVALAESLNAELWSADQRLIHALQAQGVSWAHWIGEVS